MLVTIATHYHHDVQAQSIIEEAIQDKGKYAAFARMVKSKYVK